MSPVRKTDDRGLRAEWIYSKNEQKIGILFHLAVEKNFPDSICMILSFSFV